MFTRLLMKVLLNGIAVIPLLMWLGGASLTGSILTALTLTVIAYLIGDLFILRRTNNLVATLADFGLAFLFFWAADRTAGWALTFTEMLVISAAVGVVEYAVHRMMLQDTNQLLGK